VTQTRQSAIVPIAAARTTPRKYKHVSIAESIYSVDLTRHRETKPPPNREADDMKTTKLRTSQPMRKIVLRAFVLLGVTIPAGAILNVAMSYGAAAGQAERTTCYNKYEKCSASAESRTKADWAKSSQNSVMVQHFKRLRYTRHMICVSQQERCLAAARQ